MHVRRFRRDAPPACFGGLAPMVAVWQGKCRNDALPRWKDFAIEDFVGWHRYVALSDLEPDGDPRFRIFGSGVAEILRSEEQTSELQSLMRILYAFCSLKKKQLHSET